MKHPFAGRRLGEILVERGVLTAEQRDAGLHGTEGLIGERLIALGHTDEEQVARALAEQFRMPYADLKGFAAPPELFSLFPAQEAYRANALPLAREDDTLRVALSDPLEGDRLTDELERRTGLRIVLSLAGPAAVREALERSQAASALLRDVSDDFRAGETGEEKDSVSAATVDDQESAVVRLINTILLGALQRRASDIHFETYETGTVVKYRVDGLLYPATEKLDRRNNKAFVSRVKVMADLDIAESRVPQDGRFQLRLNGRDIDFRVSILPGAVGEDVVIRVLDRAALNREFSQLRLESLGLDPATLGKFRRAIREPYGMVLITGPTGSGKTTTLYAALGEINTGEEKIITIEDPVEYQLNGVVQVPVNEKKGLTFARGLRSILRHDPDKVMVGEIRDPETAQIAVQSALTGHLVFTTLHANNACDVVGRFAHMGIHPAHFVSCLNCVMAQRLVRVVCPRCRRKAKAAPELLVASGLDPGTCGEKDFAVGAGCDYCGGTGYRGRVAVAEFLDLTPRVRQMIADQRPGDAIHAAAVEEGMVSLRRAAMEKALEGETTLREVNRVTFMD